MKLRHSTLRILLTLYPRLASLPHAEQDAAAGYATRALVFSPLAIAALIWLAQITDLAALTPVWPLVIIAFVLMFVLSRLWFQTFYRTESGGYRSEGRSFWGEVLWSAVLVAITPRVVPLYVSARLKRPSPDSKSSRIVRPTSSGSMLPCPGRGGAEIAA